MTRKKQAPQKLNSKNETEVSNNTTLSLQEESSNHSVLNSSPKIEPKSDHLETEQKNSDKMANTSVVPSSSVDSSCQKLLNFTQNFSFSGETKARSFVKQEKDLDWSNNKHVASSGKYPSRATDVSSTTRNSARFSESGTQEKTLNGEITTKPTTSLNEAVNRSTTVNGGLPNGPAHSTPMDHADANKVLPSSEADVLKGLDLASLTAAHKFLMDAIQQKQIYEQCASNWMSVQQRTDNNCLSKSKAERYRWCVQGGDNTSKSSRVNPASQSHVNNLKKSASMAGVGVTPVHDKLYSAVLTGASKFCCRDCGSPFNTLVDLTVHMNKTGHFRDTNIDAGKSNSSQKEPASSSAQKPKKKPTLEEDVQNEKVLTCMGCGNLFESLQDLSVHMIKTKHYENVPSLRMWSQKQTPPLENSAVAGRKRSIPSMTNYKKMDPSHVPPGIDQQSMFRSPFGVPPFIPGVNNAAAAAAAYTSMLYSSPWLASGLPPSMLPSLYASSVGFPYPYLYPPGLLSGGMLSMPFPPSGDDFEGKIACTKCKEPFSSFQNLTEHIQETSHFPDVSHMHSVLGNVSSSNASTPTSSDSKTVVNSSKSSSVSSAEKSLRTPTSRARSSVDNSASISSPNKKSHRDSSLSSPEFDRKSSASSFDFIRSLESTIKSAISKVESPRDDKPISPRNTVPVTDGSTGFGSFFSAIADRPKTETLTLKSLSALDKARSEDAFKVKIASDLANNPAEFKEIQRDKMESNVSSVSSVGTLQNSDNSRSNRKLGKSESPLDLTLKREIAEQLSKASVFSNMNDVSHFSSHSLSAPSLSSEQEKNSADHQDKKFDFFSALSRKTPLQCIHDNIQAFFSLMNPKFNPPDPAYKDVLRKSNSPPYTSQSRVVTSPEPYKPIMIPTNATTSNSNPLQEMLKIVNSTDLRKVRSSVDQDASRKHSSLKRPSFEHSPPVEAKKSKISTLLHDLVMPKDESPVSSVNPLQKIQDLVENKLQRSEEAKKTPPTSRKLSLTNPFWDSRSNSNISSLIGLVSRESVVDSVSSTSNSQALNSSRYSIVKTEPTSKNGFHLSPSSKRALASSSASDVNIDSEAGHHENNSEDVTLKDLELEATFARLFASGEPPEDEEIKKHLDLSSNRVSTWFARMTREFQSRGQLPFLRYHDNNGQKQVELLCRRCGMLFETAERFSIHVTEHLDARKRLDEEKTKLNLKSEPTSPDIRGKCTIQGALCIGPYQSFKDAMNHPEDAVEETKDDSASGNFSLHLVHPNKRNEDTSSSNDETITVSS